MIGQDVQTASFDPVSGATLTSNAINGALKQMAKDTNGIPTIIEEEAKEKEAPVMKKV